MSTNLYCQNYQLTLQLTLIEPLLHLHYKGDEYAGDNCAGARLRVTVEWVVTKSQGLVSNAVRVRTGWRPADARGSEPQTAVEVWWGKSEKSLCSSVTMSRLPG